MRQLRAEGLSYQAIGERIGRAKSYVGWLVAAEGIGQDTDDIAGDDLVRYAAEELGAVLVKGTDRPRSREGDDLAPVPVGV